MNSIKSYCSFLLIFVLSVGFSYAQVTSTTATQPTSTSSGNRMQELYDQYHGVSKKTGTPTSTAPSPAPDAPVVPQRRGNDGSGAGAATNQPRRVASATTEPGVQIGVRGGVTYLTFTTSQPLIDPKLGFVGGVMLNVGSGRFSFQPEVNYARYKLASNNITAAFDQFEVPLLLKISSGNYDGNRFFVNIGPYGSYISSTSINGRKLTIDGVSDKFHYGLVTGLGASLKAGPGHIVVEARGMYQLDEMNTGFTTDTKAILLQGTVGYSFPLGGR